MGNKVGTPARGPGMFVIQSNEAAITDLIFIFLHNLNINRVYM